MKKSEIKVGGHYLARVNDRLVTVRVDAIHDNAHSGSLSRQRYDVTNLATGRKTTFRSAQKFRSVVELKKDARAGWGTGQTTPYDRADDLRKIESAEQERQGAEQQVEVQHLDAGDPRVKAEDVYATLAEAEQRPDPTTSPIRSDGKTTARPTTTGSSSPFAAKLGEMASGDDTAPHVVVEARAGTGKTTTLVEGLKELKGIGSALTPSPQQKAVWDAMKLGRSPQSICFVAFNKSIATELQARVPAGCDAMTMHSMGYKAVTRMFGRQEPSSWAVQDIIAELLNDDLRDLKAKPGMLTAIKATEELVGLCKQNLTPLGGVGEQDNLQRLADYYDIDLNGSRAKVFELVPRVLERCKTPKGKIAFDDMIWLPIVLNLPVFTYDLLLVDEAQDLNRCQQALAKRAGKRLVLCGDPKQAIYGFAGADAESMARMEAELGGERWAHFEGGSKTGTPSSGRGCIHLPLTVTRRCGKAIVAEAQKYVPDFEAHESNGEGKVSQATFEKQAASDPFDGHQTNYATMVEDGDFILCRCNAPLVSECFKFLRAGRKANIQGRDVGAGLISTVKKLCKPLKPECVAIPTFLRKLGDWLHAETAKEQAKRQPSENKLTALQDRADCLSCFAEGSSGRFNEPDPTQESRMTVADVVCKIESVFTDDKKSPGIKLSSIHKAKGLEAKRVFILRPPGVGPREDKMQPWELVENDNIKYVAITRAIEEVVYVS